MPGAEQRARRYLPRWRQTRAARAPPVAQGISVRCSPSVLGATLVRTCFLSLYTIVSDVAILWLLLVILVSIQARAFVHGVRLYVERL